MAASPSAPDPEHAARLAWITQVRGLHRIKRMLGFAGIMLGAGIVVWWKLDANAPEWAMWTGTAILGASWALFVYVIIARYLWVKKHPYGVVKT
jgi:type IV secretory pathway TraG/TraD family ATPase VirD4